MEGVAEWTAGQVAARIGGLSWVDAELLAGVREHEIDGAALLELTKDDLKEDLGVKELGRVKKILRGIAQLEEDYLTAKCETATRACSAGGASPAACDGTRDAGPGPGPTAAGVDSIDVLAEAPADERATPVRPPAPPQEGWASGGGGGKEEEAAASPGGTSTKSPVAAGTAPTGLLGDLDGDICDDDLKPSHTRSSEVGSADSNAPPSPALASAATPPPPSRRRRSSCAAVTPTPIATNVQRPTPPPKRPHTAMAVARRHTDTGLCRLEASEVDATPQKRPATAQAGATGRYSMGILETERRYAELCVVYKAWRGCLDPQSKLSLSNLVSTLKIYFSLSVDEAAAMASELRDIVPHTYADLQADGFAAVLSNVTESMPPAHFDHLRVYISRCIEKTAGVQERRRRERLVHELFAMWDYDGSGGISTSEYETVMKRFQEVSMDADLEDEEGGFRNMTQADADTSGELDISEFSALLLTVWEAVSPASFDLKYLRLGRAVEDVILCNISTSESRITSKALIQIVSAVLPSTPIILYGTGADPSRAVEECAMAFGVTLKPVLVTHKSAEAEAIRAITRYGIGRGHWVYIVIGKRYNADTLHREVGRRLQTTNTWMVHPKFRLVISSPTRSTASLPAILTMHAVQASTEDCDVDRLLHQIAASQGPWRVSFSAQQKSKAAWGA